MNKEEINGEMDKLIEAELKLTKQSDGMKCPRCGVIQGNPLKGFDHYYCKHTTKKIDVIFKKDKEFANMKMLDFVCQQRDIGRGI